MPAQVFPNELILVPPPPTNVSDRQWLQKACDAMKSLTKNVTASLQSQGVPHYSMELSDLSGLVVVGGRCVGEAYDLLMYLEKGHFKNGTEPLADIVFAQLLNSSALRCLWR